MLMQSATPERDEAFMSLLLVEEITHRVVNEYARAIGALRLAAARAESAEARGALIEAASALCKFAEAHRALQAPMPGAVMDLGAYLERLCRSIAAANLCDGRITLTLSVVPVMLPAERCWLAALAVAELITNSMRHGLYLKPGQVRVDLDRARDRICCKVTDDGVAPADPSPGRGSHVVRSLAGRLGGEVAWRFSSRGSAALLTFPLNADS